MIQLSPMNSSHLCMVESYMNWLGQSTNQLESQVVYLRRTVSGNRQKELQLHGILDCLLFDSQLCDWDRRHLRDTVGSHNSHLGHRNRAGMKPSCDLVGTNIVCQEGKCTKR